MQGYPTNASKAYNRATHTVAKTRQVVMLYDGAIRFLLQAKEAMEKGEIEKRYDKLVRASDVLMGLQSCLDFESGGPAAKVLFDFYGGMDLRIMALHRTSDAAACQQIVDEMKQMREVWDRIDRGSAESEAVMEQAQENPAPSAPMTVTVSA